LPRNRKAQERFFQSEGSKWVLEGQGDADGLSARASSLTTRNGELVVFLRLRRGHGFLLIAVDGSRWAILGTSFASTAKEAETALRADLARRGWAFG